MREPRKYTIKQLVSSNIEFVIPKYQRGYDWKGETQVKDLFSDLLACLESKYSSSLFLGSMIFDVSRERNHSEIEIIDGQQRFTTIQITLIAARNYARTVLGSEKVALKIQEDIQSEDPFMSLVLTKLRSSDSIKDVFDAMCKYEWNGDFPDSVADANGKNKRSVKRQVARVEPIYRYAYQQINDLCLNDPGHFQKLMNQIYNETYVIRIDVEEKSEAFEIFERTNARGKPLEVSDLLKNFLFSKDKEIIDHNVEDVWDRISEHSGNNILRVLKYFWISRRGHIANRDLYRSLRTYASEVTINEFVTQLQHFTVYYNAFYSTESNSLQNWFQSEDISNNAMYLAELARSCSAIRLFGVTQPLPLIFSAIMSYSKIETVERNPKQLINLLRYIESYHFINNKICHRIGNEVERVYASYSDKFYNGEDFVSTAGSCIDELKERTAERDEFVSQFRYLSYENYGDRQIIRYVFDRLANVGIKEGQRVNLIDYNEIDQGITSAFDIEHVLSQSLGSEGDDFVHEIGNLLVMPKQINGILQNDDFQLKLSKLKDPHLYRNNIVHVPSYVAEFVKYAEQFVEWNEQAINDRTDVLASQSYQSARFEYSYK